MTSPKLRKPDGFDTLTFLSAGEARDGPRERGSLVRNVVEHVPQVCSWSHPHSFHCHTRLELQPDGIPEHISCSGKETTSALHKEPLKKKTCCRVFSRTGSVLSSKSVGHLHDDVIWLQLPECFEASYCIRYFFFCEESLVRDTNLHNKDCSEMPSGRCSQMT